MLNKLQCIQNHSDKENPLCYTLDKALSYTEWANKTKIKEFIKD